MSERGVFLALPPDLRRWVERQAAEESVRRGRPISVQQYIRELLQREREERNGG